MGKPYFAYNNLLPSASVTARSEDPLYPASNLTQHRLWPGFRSAEQCLVLNGVDEYAYLPDHPDFDITGDLTIEALVSLDDLVTTYKIIAKWDGTNGYAIQIIAGGHIQFFICNGGACSITSTTTISSGAWYILKAVYDASEQQMSLFLDHIEIARATNSVQSGCTISGSIPASIGTNNLNLAVGSNSSLAGNYLKGRIAYIGLRNVEYDHGGFLDPTWCKAYWKFDGNLSDASNTDHTLSSSGVDSSNYHDCSAYNWLGFYYSLPVQPELIFIDRRHNLSSGASIQFLSSNWVSSYSLASEETAIAVAGEPIVIKNSFGGSGQYWWIEIHDPDNTDGYIDIPYIYLGDKVTMNRSFLSGYHHSIKRQGSVRPANAGSYSGYIRSEQLWEADIRFRALPEDQVILDSLADEASLMRPFVFSADGTDAQAKLVYWIDAMSPECSHIVDTQNFIDLELRECGGSL